MSNPITAADLAEALRELTESIDDLDAGAKHYYSTGSSSLTVRALNRHGPARANANTTLVRFNAQQAEAPELPPISALDAAIEIWKDLDGRSGFGLGSLRWDDPEIWDEIIREHARIIQRTGAQ